MRLVETRWIDGLVDYDGSQLRSHWIMERLGVVGDAAVAFLGGCDVRFEHMIDVEDRMARSPIKSARMLHFIIEHFDASLDLAVLRQRVLLASMCESINARLGRPALRREGSDLYDGDLKLSVSIATASPASALIHAGLNVTTVETPVPTRGLADYGIEPASFGREMLGRYAAEIESARRARCKARPAPGGAP